LRLLCNVSRCNVHRNCQSVANFNHHAANSECSINHRHTAYLQLVTPTFTSLYPDVTCFIHTVSNKNLCGDLGMKLASFIYTYVLQVGLFVGTRAETKVIISPSNLQSHRTFILPDFQTSRPRLVAYRTRTWNNTRSRTKT